MTRSRTLVLASILLLCSSLLTAQAEVSEKQEVAIFALGYYGWNIPLEALSTIDIDIQRVFIDLGRFTIIGMEQRFASADVNDFIDTLKRSKEANFVLPERFMFGEAFLTDAEFNKLVGAFIIAVPVVTSFNSQWVNNREWKTDIKTNVSFINVADGTLMGVANVETSASSRESQYRSIKNAIDGIPMQLQYEIRSIPAFQLRTQVLGRRGSQVDIQLGRDMGIQPGDEYAVINKVEIGGFVDEQEVGLIVINTVRNNTSTGTLLYSRQSVEAETQLNEIPRLGVEMSFYGHYYQYLLGDNSNDGAVALGFRADMSRGFYSVRPYADIEVLLDSDKLFPVQTFVGAQFVNHLGRLEVGGRAAVGGGAALIVKILQDLVETSDDEWFTHFGLSGGVYASYLVSRDIKVFAEAQVNYMFGIYDIFGTSTSEFLRSFGGMRIGLGATLKL